MTMAQYRVVVRRRWFGEELEQKLAEFDHEPERADLLQVAEKHRLGGGATLFVMPAKGRGAPREYRVNDLKAAAGG